MAKIVWTEFASQDLQEVFNYTSEVSTAYASRLIDKILERVDLLEFHPQVGRIVPEFNNEKLAGID